MKITTSFILSLFLFFSNFEFKLNAQTYQHLIMYGQSLSTGQQSWPPLSTTNVLNNYMLGNQVWSNYGNTGTNPAILSPLISTLALDGYATQIKTRNSQMACECPIVSMANHIQTKLPAQFKFIASSTGTGGQTIEQLSKEYHVKTRYTDFTNCLNFAATATNNSVHCPALVYMQGEFNYNILPLNFSASNGLLSGGTPTGDKARYKSLFLKLKDNMQKDVMTKYGQIDKPIFITYQVGKQYTKGKTLEIGMAQLEASNEYSDIICAGPVYSMPDRGGHLDPNGNRWYGELLGKVYKKMIIDGVKFVPLQPIQILRTTNPKVIQVKFYVPVPPLVFETNLVPKFTDYGFEIYLNGKTTKETLVSQVISNDIVELTSSTNLIGDVEVVYAGSNTTGKGNLRDSDPYTATSNYIDLDKKDAGGNFIYTRDVTETSLRSSVYEPKYTDGTSIYGKPYPLFNFSMAFYYKLNAADQTLTIPNVGSTTFVNVASVSLSTATSNVISGTPQTITATVLPTNATNKSVMWSSSNPAIATVVGGVITAVGKGTATITATTVDQGKTATCSVSVSILPQSAYPNGTPAVVPGTIEFENFDNGGTASAYYDITSGNSGNIYRTSEDVDIQTCLDLGGGYQVTSTAVGEWMEYTVNVTKAESHSVSIRYAATAASKVHFEVGGVNVSGTINLAATGGATTFQTVRSFMTLSAGVQEIRIVVDLGSPILNNFTLGSTTIIDILNSAIEPGLNLYPNPARNIITLAFSCLTMQNLKCDFLDSSGKVMKYIELMAVDGVNLLNLDVSDLKSGTYLLKIKGANKVMSKTFVKI